MTDAPVISPLDQARILSEALPHMQQYDEETIVIKYGGHAMGAEDMAKAFARDIVLLEQTAINPVVVHGGGPQIATMLLFHATAVLGAIALIERRVLHLQIGLTAAAGFVIAAALFAGDLTMRTYAGHGLFPMAAPTGGTLLIISWLALAVAAAWPKDA